MAKRNSFDFRVSYDANADTLYITAKAAPAARGVEDARGIVWRYDAGGDVISATVMDFHDVWAAQPDALAFEIAKRFDIPRPQAQTVVEHALEEERPRWLD
jgi:uncharacterized protein YuzE